MMFSHSKKENNIKEKKREDNNKELKRKKKYIFNFLYLGSRVLRIKEKR